MKACNGCTLCCTIFAVDELNKPRWQTCEHQIPGVGCGCYDTRPERCRVFSCLYQQEVTVFGPPEEVGYVAGFNVTTRSIDIHPDPARPDAWQDHSPGLVDLGSTVPVVLVLEDRAFAVGELAKKFEFVK